MNEIPITEKQYMWYILQGYDITIKPTFIVFRMNRKLHRTNGPAIESSYGYKAWWINDINYSEEEFNEAVKRLV